MQPEVDLRLLDGSTVLTTVRLDPDLALTETLGVLDRTGFDQAAGFVQGRRAHFVRLVDGQLVTPAGALDRIDDLWEVDVWAEEQRCRWHREHGASISSRKPLPLEERLVVTSETTPIMAELVSRMVMWGAASEPAPGPGWSRLAEDRIGQLLVPVGDAAAGSHVVLEMIELVAADQDGNAVVVEELPGRFEIVSEEDLGA